MGSSQFVHSGLYFRENYPFFPLQNLTLNMSRSQNNSLSQFSIVYSLYSAPCRVTGTWLLTRYRARRTGSLCVKGASLSGVRR